MMTMMKALAVSTLLVCPTPGATAREADQQAVTQEGPVPSPPQIIIRTPPPPVFALPPPVLPSTIRDTPIYTYSFLDLREAEYTRPVLDMIIIGLTDRLKAANASGPILEYRKSPQGEFLSDSSGFGSSSTAVPVREVIQGNLQQETAAGTKLRLVIFPARYDIVGAWRYYDIRWVLLDGVSMRPFWTYEYSGKHLVMWSNKENAEARAKKILDAAFEDMKARGLI